MYHPMEGGSSELIQGYLCQIPKIGYGKNRLTGKIEHVGMIKRSHKKEDQFWEPIGLPKDWNQKRKLEIQEQHDDPDYFDPELEKIREKHWQHRLCGAWIMINGVAVYIPPSFFFYLNYCPLDIGLPNYWETDREYFYVWEYCKEDPRCGGFVDIEGRRGGKTYKSGSIMLDETSLNKNYHGGIQSKTSTDAKQVFSKTVVNFFKKLPDFFRPVYDQSKGITPASELRFFQTTVKGKKADSIIGGAELESWVDYGSSDVYHYDGSKLNVYIMDEFGKTAEVSVWDRWNVVRFCLMDKGKWVGKAILTSTIEDIDATTDDPLKLWNFSDPDDRNANGLTKTGLYRFFVPAYKKCIEHNDEKFYDKFGKSDADKTRQYYLNEREGAQGDSRLLSSIIRKNPFNIHEAFRIDGTTCLYNSEKLNIQLDKVSWKELTERGNFVWKDGVRLTESEWKPSKSGHFDIAKGFIMKEPNKVIERNGHYYPANTFTFRIGADPFKFEDAKDSRRSDGAAWTFMMPDILDKQNPFTNAFICGYRHRAATTAMQYEDMLKMAWYFGSQILFESNVDSWKAYFKDSNCWGFLMYLPGEKEPGIYNDGQQQVKQYLADYTENYIENYCDRVYFKELLKEWLLFKISKTQAFDSAMSSGYSLIAAKEKIYKREPDQAREVTDYFQIYKAS